MGNRVVILYASDSLTSIPHVQALTPTWYCWRFLPWEISIEWSVFMNSSQPEFCCLILHGKNWYVFGKRWLDQSPKVPFHIWKSWYSIYIYILPKFYILPWNLPMFTLFFVFKRPTNPIGFTSQKTVEHSRPGGALMTLAPSSARNWPTEGPARTWFYLIKQWCRYISVF